MNLRLRRRRAAPAGWSPPRVTAVREQSPCAGKVAVGDLLLRIDGRPPADILDYLEASEGERVLLTLSRAGTTLKARIGKRPGVPLGLVFDEPVFDGLRTCRNRCIFCFVDQMPPGLRPTLYLKDDDYRLSFYHGNFITLNNLAASEVERIRRLRLSPLYVSLHASDAGLRDLLMGGGAGRGLEVLPLLLDAGLEIHLQVVVCPGINDGAALRRTMEDVVRTYAAASLGVVPVGIASRDRAPSPHLRPHGRESAAEVLETVREFQRRALDVHGRRLFYAADEFYLLAGEAFPPGEAYDGYPQLENGIGMARKFLDEVRREAGCGTACPGRMRGVITGAVGKEVIDQALALAAVEGVEVLEVENLLMGPGISVSALLGGGDIVSALSSSRPARRELLIPESMLREGSFIDDLTPRDVEAATGYRLIPVAVEGRAFLRALRAEEGGRDGD